MTTATVVLAVAFGLVVLALSMSGRGDAAFPGGNGRIAYSSGDSYSYSSAAIWAIDADGGSPTLLSPGSGVAAPSYSADGTRIAFDREGGVAVMDGTGAGLVQLVTGSRSNSSSVEWQKNYVDPHTSKIIPIVKIQTSVSEWQNFDHPSFTPDGSQLVVAEDAGKQTNRSVCAVASLGDYGCLYSYPNYYFNYERDCDTCGSHLVSIDSHTGVRIGALTSLGDERRDTKPSYSADGKIAFARSDEGKSSIFVIDSPGTAPRQVTTGPGDRAPDFSPDSSKIVFSHAYADIGIVGVGGGPVQLVPIPAPSAGWGGYLNSPVFSPDGSRIAFRRGVYGSGGQDETGLFTVATDGSGFTRIAADGYAPSWQPLPPPPSRPWAKARKGKIRLDKKGRATIGRVVCGSTRCRLKARSARLKTGKRSCRQVKTRQARKLAPRKSTKLRIKVNGRCLEALKQAGKGRLTVWVKARDALGKRALKLRVTLLPPKPHKRRAHR